MVNICEELGVGPGGFYQPGYQNGAKLRLQMMCLGRNWDPQTKYDEPCRGDGSEAPPIPDKLTRLVEVALKYAHDLIDSKDELPLMFPDICIVNFYKTSGRLGLHQVNQAGSAQNFDDKDSENGLAVDASDDAPWKGEAAALKPCWSKPDEEETEESQGYVIFSLTNGPEYHVSQNELGLKSCFHVKKANLMHEHHHVFLYQMLQASNFYA